MAVDPVNPSDISPVRLVDRTGSDVAMSRATVAAGYFHEPAANTAAIVTVAAVADSAIVLDTIEWSYSGDPTNGALTVEDGAGTTVKKIDITKGGPGQLVFPNGLQFTENTAVVVTLAAGAVNGIVNVSPKTVSV